MAEPSERHAALRRYFIAALPGWLLGFVAAVTLYLWADLPLWIPAIVLALWIAADIALYPRRRKYYESERATGRMVGETGVALTTIAPEGFARVHGEIWQVQTARPDLVIAKDEAVRVRAIHGLLLVVEPGTEGANINHRPPPSA